MQRLGIYGGSFDPVHLGHLLVAEAAYEELGLNRLFFVPTAQSPFKTDRTPAPAAARLRWLRLALPGKPYFEVDDQEVQRGGTSYTIDTLRDYARRFPGAELHYLIGADNAAALPQWRNAQELAGLAAFVAIPRPGEPVAVFPAPFRGRTLAGFPLALSSSQIRGRVQAGQAVTHLLPAGVADDIRNNRLYLDAVRVVSLPMDARKLAQLCRELADNKKAEDIVILDVRKQSSVTDYFVIASGNSEPHLRAILDEISRGLRDDYDLRPRAMDGSSQGAWVVLDFFDVIVHLMRADARERYDLESLWGDAPRVRGRKVAAKNV